MAGHEPAAPGRLWRGPLAIGAFRLLVLGQFTSTVGDYCYAVAFPWLILTRQGGPLLLGVVLAFYGVPRVAAIPLGGMLADRFGGWHLMMAADAVRCVTTGALALLSVLVRPELAWLAPIAVVLGLASGAFTPSGYTVLPAVLPEDDVSRGFALFTGANQVAGAIGPAFGGVVVSLAGAGFGLTVDAASYAAEQDTDDAAPDQATAPRTSLATLLRSGHLLQVTLVVAFAANLVYMGAMEVALPDLSNQRYNAYAYGTLLTIMSIGALGGTVLAGRFNGVKAVPYLLGVLACVMGLSLGLLPYAGGIVGAGIAMAVYASASGWQNIVAGTLLQTWTPAHLLGRTMSLVMLAVQGTLPLSVLIAGIEVRRTGPAPFFPAAGAVIAAAVLGALLVPAFRRYRAGDTFDAVPVPRAPTESAFVHET